MQKGLSQHPLSMRNVFLLLLACGLLASVPTWAQTSTSPYLAGNVAWLDSVQHLPLAQQLAAVQQRAWRDTLLASYQTPLCYMGVSAATRKAATSTTPPATAKPHGYPLVYVLDGRTFFGNDAGTIRQFQQAVQSHSIKQVTLLHDVGAVIYGTRGANGVVVLSSSKRKQRH